MIPEHPIITMSLLVSTANGGLRIMGLSKSRSASDKGQNTVVCQEESNIVRVKGILIHGKKHITVLRKNNTVQLYKFGSSNNFQKMKEWKSCIVCSRYDKIVDIGILDERYLFTCSYEGKLVIIDLVNDDDDLSLKQYTLQPSITSVKVDFVKNLNQVKVYIGNKSGGLKSYDINIEKEYYCPEFADSVSLLDIRNGFEEGQEHFSYIQNLNQIRRLLGRRQSELNMSKEKLHPKFDAVTTQEKGNASSMWVVSIQTSTKHIVTGTEFGYIIIYEKDNKESIKRFKVSRFPIVGLQIIGNKVIYNDIISNIGVVDWRSSTMCKFSFKFGVIEHSQIICNRRINNFQIIALTVDGILKIVNIDPTKNKVNLLKAIELNHSLDYFHIFNINSFTPQN